MLKPNSPKVRGAKYREEFAKALEIHLLVWKNVEPKKISNLEAVDNNIDLVLHSRSPSMFLEVLGEYKVDLVEHGKRLDKMGKSLDF